MSVSTIDLFAAAQGDGEAGVVVAVEELERGGFHRRNDDIDGAGGKFPKRGSALLLHVRVRREIFERKHVVGREAHDARRVDGAGQLAAGLEQRLQGLGRFVVGHDHDDRLARGPRHQRKIQSARGCGEPGDTPPPRSEAQMPANALKSRRMLQLRENFADKRENHQGLV